MTITLESINRLLTYDPITGIFVRKVRRSNALAGSIAGSKNIDGYLNVEIDGKKYKLHRLAWLIIHGSWPAVIDHINGDRADNRIENLQSVTQLENTQNIFRAKGSNANGLLGSHFHKPTGKWRARIRANGKNIALGAHASPELAHAAYMRAKALYHPTSGLARAAAAKQETE